MEAQAGAGSSGFTIRRATPDDARAIAEVHVASWQSAYRGQLPDEFLDGLRVEPRVPHWRDVIGNPDETVLVAESAGRVVGFGSATGSGDPDAAADTGEVSTIYLLPEALGRGIGRTLFAQLTDDLVARGYRRATLWVLASNEKSRRFYEAAGWRADGTTKVEPARSVLLEEARYARDLSAPGDPTP